MSDVQLVRGLAVVLSQTRDHAGGFKEVQEPPFCEIELEVEDLSGGALVGVASCDEDGGGA